MTEMATLSQYTLHTESSIDHRNTLSITVKDGANCLRFSTTKQITLPILGAILSGTSRDKFLI